MTTDFLSKLNQIRGQVEKNPYFIVLKSEWAWLVFAIFFTGFMSYIKEDTDWTTFHQATHEGWLHIELIANPPYTGVFLWPLAQFEYETGIWIIRFFNVFIIFLASRMTHINAWLLSFSYPGAWLLTANQLDGLVALGAILGWWSIKNYRPFVTGVAAALLGIKPQVGGFYAVYLLWRGRNWLTFWPLGIIFFISVYLYGWWPFDWLIRLQNLPSYLTGASRISVGSIPLALLAASVFIWRFRDYNEINRAQSLIIMNLFSASYAAMYSAFSLLCFPIPLWLYPAFFAGYPFGVEAVPIFQGAMLIIVLLPLWPKSSKE